MFGSRKRKLSTSYWPGFGIVSRMRFVSAVVLAVYLVGYLWLRVFNSEVWSEDNRAYVMFPESPIALYYVYRPLSYIDQYVTGMRSHIGPHQ